MPSERSLWQYLRKGMKGRWRAQRLEDKLSEGIPDLCYAIYGKPGCGFIELKYKAAWPKRALTPLRIQHYTQEQKLWIGSMGDLSGSVFLLLQVAKEYLLFDSEAAQYVGEYTRGELTADAMGHWLHSVDWDELQEMLA